MSKVYYIENTESDYKQLGKDALELLKRIVSETGHKFEKEVPIKCDNLGFDNFQQNI